MLYYCYILDFSFEEQSDTVICTGSDIIFTVCVVIEHSYERLHLAQDMCLCEYRSHGLVLTSVFCALT